MNNDNCQSAPEDMVGTNQILAELAEVLNELQRAIDALRKDPQSRERQIDVCLRSRSAYSDFYSITVLAHAVDPDSRCRLQDLFASALAIPWQGRYRDSVEDRAEDFKRFCDDVNERDPQDTSVSAFDLI
jgi:hypothetical protein